MKARRIYNFPDRKTLTLGNKTIVMGILNITPDSFSDGGKWNAIDRALYHMQNMISDGADIIDVGAESTRSGFIPMDSQEEIERLLPFLEKIIAESSVPISVDTFKVDTAREAIKAGVHMLNDIWGLQYENEPMEMAKLAAKHQIPIVVMHNQIGTNYSKDIIESIRDFFIRTIQIADVAGLKRDRLIFDPGIGFGKLPLDNVMVLKRQDELLKYEGEIYPLLLGASRKSYIGVTLGLDVSERMEATGATCVLGIAKGASIVRVHDVKPITRMVRMTDVILSI